MFVRAGGCLDLIDWLGDGWRRGGRPVAWVRWVGLPAGQLVARATIRAEFILRHMHGVLNLNKKLII